jgi:ankyrin repeat protein
MYPIFLIYLFKIFTFREIVVLLLEHEASPNIVDSKGSSPLHLAAWAGHSDIVRLLLTTGVRVTQINLKVSLSLLIFLNHCNLFSM